MPKNLLEVLFQFHRNIQPVNPCFWTQNLELLLDFTAIVLQAIALLMSEDFKIRKMIHTNYSYYCLCWTVFNRSFIFFL